jgi:hypothetical protein
VDAIVGVSGVVYFVKGSKQATTKYIFISMLLHSSSRTSFLAMNKSKHDVCFSPCLCSNF